MDERTLKRWIKVLYILNIAFVVLIILINISNGLDVIQDEFSDGSSNVNISFNNSKNVDLILDVNVNEAKLNISGLLGYCSQEFANQSSACGLSNGSYVIDGSANYSSNFPAYNCIDGNVSTRCGPASSDVLIGRIYENESIPVGANSSSLFNVKLFNTQYRNLSINSSCFNNPLQLQSIMYNNGPSGYVNFSCYNNTEWLVMYNYPAIISGAILYETSMLWHVYPQNVSIYTNGTRVYNNIGALNTTVQVDLNTSIIQNHANSSMDNNASIRFNFTADYFGTLNLYSLKINYSSNQIGILDIVSPSSISENVLSGGDVIKSLVLNNTGNYNISNLSFISVSSESPTMNNFMSSNCTGNNLTIGASVSCSLLLTDVTLNSDSDEKLKVRGRGSPSNDTVYSDGIDLDINIVPSAGGGGGGEVTEPVPQCFFSIVKPTSFIYKIAGVGETSDTKIFIYNNFTVKSDFKFSFENLTQCDPINDLQIEGQSLREINLRCVHNKDEEGKLLINNGLCSKNLFVTLKSGYGFIVGSVLIGVVSILGLIVIGMLVGVFDG